MLFRLIALLQSHESTVLHKTFFRSITDSTKVFNASNFQGRKFLYCLTGRELSHQPQTIGSTSVACSATNCGSQITRNRYFWSVSKFAKNQIQKFCKFAIISYQSVNLDSVFGFWRLFSWTVCVTIKSTQIVYTNFDLLHNTPKGFASLAGLRSSIA